VLRHSARGDARLRHHHWNYYASIAKDPVEARGTILDLGTRGQGMTYEYVYKGKRYEDEDIRRSAFGKWVGAATKVTLSTANPARSTTNLPALRARAIEFGWISGGLLTITSVALIFALRHKPSPQAVIATPQRRSETLPGIVMLAAFAAFVLAGTIGLERVLGEQDWLSQMASVANRPETSAEQKVRTLDDSSGHGTNAFAACDRRGWYLCAAPSSYLPSQR